MTGTAESCSRHGQDVLFLEQVDEFHVVFDGAFGKQIKRAVGHIKLISRLFQTLAEQIPAAPVNIYVHGDPLEPAHHLLEQGRGVDVHHGVGHAGRSRHQPCILRFRVHGQITDAFPG